MHTQVMNVKAPSSHRSDVVIILGGWSPGPLLYIENTFVSQGCMILMPTIPMPPMPGSWCCHPKVLLLVVLQVVIYTLLHTFTNGWSFALWTLIDVVIWFRILAAIVVRSSIDRSIQITTNMLLEQQQEANNNKTNVIIVGFSWGGAVLAEMLAKNMVGGTGQPMALMIAPTTSLVASVAMQKDSALRIQRNQISNNMNVHVVHGTADETFCPNQDRWNNTNVSLHRIHDNHVFSRLSSKRYLNGIATNLQVHLRDQRKTSLF